MHTYFKIPIIKQHNLEFKKFLSYWLKHRIGIWILKLPKNLQTYLELKAQNSLSGVIPSFSRTFCKKTDSKLLFFLVRSNLMPY